MAPGQQSRIDAAELARLRAKLDGYESMGLRVGHLRELLDRDPEAFKATYMADIKGQLSGAPPAPSTTTPPAGEAVEVRVGPLSEEERTEELELRLEGAGPEEAIPETVPGKAVADVGTSAQVDEIASTLMKQRTDKEEVQKDLEKTMAQLQKGTDAVMGELGTTTKADEQLMEEDAGAQSSPDASKQKLRDEQNELNDWLEREIDRYNAGGKAAEDIGKAAVGPGEGAGAPELAKAGAPKADRLTAMEQAATDRTLMDAGKDQSAEGEADKEVLGAMLGEPEAGIEIVSAVETRAPEVTPSEGAPEGTEGGAAWEGEEPPGAFEVSPMTVLPSAGEALTGEGIEGPEAGGEVTPGAAGPDVGEEAPEGPGAAAEEGPEEAPPAAAGPAASAGAGAEAGAKAAVRPPRTRRKPLGRGFKAVAVVSLLVVGGLGGYFVFFSDTPPVAAFTYGPDSPVVGQQVTFDASNSSDADRYGIREYRWAFGDQGTGKGRIAHHSYASSGDFTVTLTVLDTRDARGVARLPITLGPLKVTMAAPHIGDSYKYSVTGHSSASNPDGLYTYSIKIAGQPVPITIVVKEVRMRLSGDKTQSVDDNGEAEDGFLKTHDVRFETTLYDIKDIEGLVMTNQATDAVLVGTLTATITEAICNEWDRPVRTAASVIGRFTVEPSFVFTETDTGTFYNELSGISDSFSLPSFLRSTQFNSEDRSDHQLQVGDGTYVWRVRGMERVEGRTGLALHINVTMSDETRRAAGLDAFYTDVWLEPGLPLPVKDHVHTKAYSGGNTLIVDLTETMTTGTRGPDDVGKTCRPATHSYTPKGEFAGDFNMIDQVPDHGGTGGGFAFTDTEAVDRARAALPDFDAWLSSRPEAFCHDGNYSVSSGRGMWQLAFGNKSSSEHYRISVLAEATPTGGVFIQDGRPKGSRADIGSVVCLSRGLKLMRNDAEVSDRAFSGLDPDWSRFNLTIGEGAQSVPLSPTAIGSATGGGYVYMLQSRDDPTSAQGRYRAALDATNGQILFSWTQKETLEGKIGGGG
jgi:hypothetical protein